MPNEGNSILACARCSYELRSGQSGLNAKWRGKRIPPPPGGGEEIPFHCLGRSIDSFQTASGSQRMLHKAKKATITNQCASMASRWGREQTPWQPTGLPARGQLKGCPESLVANNVPTSTNYSALLAGESMGPSLDTLVAEAPLFLERTFTAACTSISSTMFSHFAALHFK